MTTCTFLCVCPLVEVCVCVFAVGAQYMCSSQRLESPFVLQSGCQCLTQGGRLSRPLYTALPLTDWPLNYRKVV